MLLSVPDGVVLQPPKLPPKQNRGKNNANRKVGSSLRSKPAAGPPLAVVGPSTRDTLLYGPAGAAALASAHQRRQVPKNPAYYGNQRRRAEESSDSEPEWSDEDKEYVYYVNASHV